MSISESRRRAYTNERRAIVDALPEIAPGSVVVDVGCSNGAIARLLQRERAVSVVGIEADPSLAAEAIAQGVEVHVGDALETLTRLYSVGFSADAILFADVLEHLVDPWAAITTAIELMPDGGWLVASVPNVAHYDTIVHLLRGTWPMRDRGIHDDTHLRFFGRRDIGPLLERERTNLVSLRSIYRLIERPSRLNRIARFVGPIWRNGLTFQYLATVQVSPATDGNPR